LTCPFDFWLLIFNFIPLPSNKKPPAWEALAFYFFVPVLWFSSIAPRLTGRQAKEKEEKEIKTSSLSLHFELHETR